jgi:hypothetical protein
MTKRKIVVEGKIYEWMYHSGGAVIWDGDKKHHATGLELTGLTPDQHERGHWKRTGYGVVSPRFIRAWIERTLLGRDVGIPRPYRLDRFTSTPLQPKPVETLVDFVQPDVYLIMVRRWNDEAGHEDDHVVGATLDPALAKEIAKARNDARTETDFACEVMFYATPMKLEYRRQKIAMAA